MVNLCTPISWQWNGFSVDDHLTIQRAFFYLQVHRIYCSKRFILTNNGVEMSAHWVYWF